MLSYPAMKMGEKAKFSSRVGEDSADLRVRGAEQRITLSFSGPAAPRDLRRLAATATELAERFEEARTLARRGLGPLESGELRHGARAEPTAPAEAEKCEVVAEEGHA